MAEQRIDALRDRVAELEAEGKRLREALQTCLNGIDVIVGQFKGQDVPCEAYAEAARQARAALQPTGGKIE